MRSAAKILSLLLLVLSVALVGCGSGTKTADQPADKKTAEPFRIVTSFYPMYVAAINITDGIDGVEVHNMTKPQTGCLHDYQLMTEDMKTLENADAFIINGAGMEDFMDKVTEQQKELKVIDASRGIELTTTVTGVSDRDALFVRLLQQDSTGCRSVYVDGAQWQGVKRFAEGSITSVRRTAERMAMTVSAPSEVFLVTSELFYPLRWQATLDGKPVSTQEVNGLIRGVRIPAGKHELVFVYDRSDFDKGRTISLAAFGVALLMLAGGFVARRAGGSQKQEV